MLNLLKQEAAAHPCSLPYNQSGSHSDWLCEVRWKVDFTGSSSSITCPYEGGTKTPKERRQVKNKQADPL